MTSIRLLANNQRIDGYHKEQILVEGFINPFKNKEEEKLFVVAVEKSLAHCTERFNDAIPKDSFGLQKTLDDKHPDQKTYMTFYQYSKLSKPKRAKCFFDEDNEEVVTYKVRKTGEVITESTNIYKWTPQTAEKTKEVATKFYIALAIFCKELGIDFHRAEGKGFDFIINGIRCEGKIGQSKDLSSIATGNNHSKVKVDCVISVQFKMSGNDFTDLWVGVVDMSKASSKDTKWSDDVSKTGKNNNGFSKLTISIEDANIVKCLCGEITPATKYIQVVHESLV